MNISEKLRNIEKELGRLSPAQKILLGTDGSVTKMLEVITGSPVGITTRVQEIIGADNRIAGELQIDPGDPVNYRVVELKNNDTAEVLVYAVSYTPVNRLDPEVKADFMLADIPIGKIMQKHKMETRREITDAGVLRADTRFSRTFGIFKDEALLSRDYRIIHHNKPIIKINEVFPYNRFPDEKAVIVEAPSRIHLGLIDMHGGIGRVDGGIGISVNEPGVLIEARPNDSLEVHCDEPGMPGKPGKPGKSDPGCADVVQRAAEQVISKMGLYGGARLTVRRWPHRHAGLGSGTALSLATARALMELSGKELSVRDMAKLTGRGGTSGIGTASFEHGGFIVDGGHSFGNNGEKSAFKPSSASAEAKPAPVTVNLQFPKDWKVLLAIPNMPPGANGQEEADIFKKFCPVPKDDVRELCHEVLMRMLPGVSDCDLDLFGSSVNRIQNIGFKKVELSLQPPYIPDLIELMRNSGAACAGMSSFGPALYAIGDTGMKEIQQSVKDYMSEYGEGGEIIITSACNTGAQVRV